MPQKLSNLSFQPAHPRALPPSHQYPRQSVSAQISLRPQPFHPVLQQLRRTRDVLIDREGVENLDFLFQKWISGIF